jgi:arginine repressor
LPHPGRARRPSTKLQRQSAILRLVQLLPALYVGTITGDDTILVITRSPSARQRPQRRIDTIVD